MILGLNYWDGNYFGKAIKIKETWYILVLEPFNETYSRVAETKNIDEYIKENKLIKF